LGNAKNAKAAKLHDRRRSSQRHCRCRTQSAPRFGAGVAGIGLSGLSRAHELQRRRHRVECEVGVPLEFEGVLIEVGYRIDMRIDQLVLVENKTVEKVLPIHLAQLLTYLKLSGLSSGLIINWNVILLRDGIQRVVRNHPEEPGGRIGSGG